MQILSIDPEPIERLRFTNAGRRGKTVTDWLPIHLGEVAEVPEGLDALVITSDLQGVARPLVGGELTLLGICLVDALLELAQKGLIPSPERTGVVLAGDLYSAPGGDVRGASGDVREVWRAFAAVYPWVAGVQGNHDRFGDADEQREFSREPGVHLLDGSVVELSGLRVGGVGGVVGDPRKPARRAHDEFHFELLRVLERGPEVLVLHEGPHGTQAGQRGNPAVAEQLQGFTRLLVCGHVHWDEPLGVLEGGPAVLNVDKRVVVLTPARG